MLTSWRTWLNATGYYAKIVVEVRDIVNSFEGDRVLVKRAKTAVNDLEVREYLVKIQRDHQLLPQLIKKMESSKCTGLKNHTEVNHKHYIENNLQCIANNVPNPILRDQPWTRFVLLDSSAGLVPSPNQNPVFAIT